MKIENASKLFFISLASGLLSFVLFILIYAQCSWGGCGKGLRIPLIATIILSAISLIYFLRWIWKIILLTFQHKSEENLLSSEKNKRDILLSTVSIVLILYSINYIHHLIKVSGLVKNSYFLFHCPKVILVIVGSVGIWLNRRWGAFVLIFIFSIIYIPQILPFISRLPHWNIQNVSGFLAFIALTIILSIKFKNMK